MSLRINTDFGQFECYFESFATAEGEHWVGSCDSIPGTVVSADNLTDCCNEMIISIEYYGRYQNIL